MAKSKIDKFIAMLQNAGPDGISKDSLRKTFPGKKHVVYGLVHSARKRGYSIKLKPVDESENYAIVGLPTPAVKEKNTPAKVSKPSLKYDGSEKHLEAMCKRAQMLPPDEQQIFSGLLRKSISCHISAQAMVEADKIVTELMVLQ